MTTAAQGVDDVLALGRRAAHELAALGLEAAVLEDRLPPRMVVKGLAFRLHALPQGDDAWGAAAELLAQVRALDGGLPFLCVADRLTASQQSRLAGLSLDVVDARGNAHIDQPGLRVEVAGRGPHEPQAAGRAAAREGRVRRRGGLSVTFVLLMDPQLRTAPLRQVAAAAGVSTSTAHEVVAALRGDGHLLRDGRLDVPVVSRAWVADYERGLSPEAMIGRFTAPAGWWREVRPEDASSAGLVWGGETAAELLGRHLRTSRGVAYVPALPAALMARLRMAAARRGAREMDAFAEFRRPLWSPTWPLVAQWKGVAPPLLVYADLLASNDARLRETAHELGETCDDLRPFLD